ncbi:MAG: hypothetical protein ABIL58_26915 [Pseudomonadota bacterium]
MIITTTPTARVVANRHLTFLAATETILPELYRQTPIRHGAAEKTIDNSRGEAQWAGLSI